LKVGRTRVQLRVQNSHVSSLAVAPGTRQTPRL
jgi:hypothetical protein